MISTTLKTQVQEVSSREQAARDEITRLRQQLASADRARDDAAQRAAAQDATIKTLEAKLVGIAFSSPRDSLLSSAYDFSSKSFLMVRPSCRRNATSCDVRASDWLPTSTASVTPSPPQSSSACVSCSLLFSLFFTLFSSELFPTFFSSHSILHSP